MKLYTQKIARQLALKKEEIAALENQALAARRRNEYGALLVKNTPRLQS